MFSYLAFALVMFSDPETPEIDCCSRLAGWPDQVSTSLKVHCDDTSFSFDFNTLEDGVSIKFDREPMKPSEKLSAEVAEALRQFSGIPILEAWCPARRDGEPVQSLWLDATGFLGETSALAVSNNEARKDCIQRGGMYDDKSWRRIFISTDRVFVDGDEIGKCTTKEDIDKYQKWMRDSVK